MSSLGRFFRFMMEFVFCGFLAAYWYLVHSLHPEFAVAGVLAVYVIYRSLRSRLSVEPPQAILLVLGAVAIFLMLNPLPGLYGLTLLAWSFSAALLFRLVFYHLASSSLKIATLLASYLLFLALPLGLPRITADVPSDRSGEPLHTVVVGAGFGGITMGKELLDAGISNFRIYEGAPQVGGTWWHNRYPGLHVDVQSALYSLSYFPNPKWSKLWAPRDELLEYSIDASKAAGVRPFIQFNTWVSGIQFDEAERLWRVSLGEEQVLSRHVVLANGGLHAPNTPDFQGAEDFAGISFHSARWREDVELAGKRIAVIGSGASAVQIIPEIAKTATQVDMYQRTPNWITTQDNRQVSRLRQWVYEYVPMAYKLQRLRNHVVAELGYRAVFPLDSSFRADVEQQLKTYVRETVTDKDLVDKLIPDYEFGCKRPLVTQHFYPSLNRDNVGVITEGIDRLTSEGILSNAGTERDYDVIILATGYKVASLPFPIQGKDNSLLEEVWKEKPQAYRTMMVNGFPNLYFLSGPNSGFFGSFIVHIESAAQYVIQVIRKTRTSLLIEPSLDAQQEYNRKLQADLQKTVWAGSCKSWYKLEDGHVIANHPHPTSRVLYERSRPDWNDFLINESDH